MPQCRLHHSPISLQSPPFTLPPGELSEGNINTNEHKPSSFWGDLGRQKWMHFNEEIRAEKKHSPRPLRSFERPHDEISWLRNSIPSGTVPTRHSPAHQAHLNKPSSDSPGTSGTGQNNHQQSRDTPRLSLEKQAIQAQKQLPPKSSSCPHKNPRAWHK